MYLMVDQSKNCPSAANAGNSKAKHIEFVSANRFELLKISEHIAIAHGTWNVTINTELHVGLIFENSLQVSLICSWSGLP